MKCPLDELWERVLCHPCDDGCRGWEKEGLWEAQAAFLKASCGVDGASCLPGTCYIVGGFIFLLNFY